MEATPEIACALAEEDAPPPFFEVAPLRLATPLIFASPHSGRRYPECFLSQTRAPLALLRRLEDAYVDELIAGGAAHGVTLLCAAYARAFIDLNRHGAELDAEMFLEGAPEARRPPSSRVLAGLGAIPRITSDGAEIYPRKLSILEARRRISAIHRPYHARLTALLDAAREAHGLAILIDCHSMPSSPRPAGAADIVLGDRYGSSCHPSLTALVEAVLRRRGYRVARNAPFAGGHTTQTHGRPSAGFHALQIEINRALYMDEHSLTRTAGFDRVRNDMAALAETLASANLHRSLA